MSAPIVLDLTDRNALLLRRSAIGPCSVLGDEHLAEDPIGDEPLGSEMADDHTHDMDHAKDEGVEVHWPRACPCGYAFVESDSWLKVRERLYRRRDTRALVTEREARRLWPEAELQVERSS